MAVTGNWSLNLKAGVESRKEVGPFHSPRLVVVNQGAAQAAVETSVVFRLAGTEATQRILSSGDSVAAECNEFTIVCRSGQDTRIVGDWSAE